MLYAIVTLLVIIADQWVKFWVAGNIPINRGFMEVIPGFLSIVNIHNDGAAFGFLSGENASLIFIGLALLMTVVVIILLAARIVKNGLARWSLIFIMAGGLGNCLDRIIYGYVQDMFRFDFVNFAIFNVADIFITVFCVLLIIAIIFGRSGSDDYEEDDYYDDDEEEEDEKPEMSRRERKKAEREAKKAAKLAKKKAEEEYDDEEEEDDMVSVSKRPAPAVEEPTGRKARQQKLDEDYEKFKANRASRPAINTEPTKRAAAVDPANPFAEWESMPGTDNRPGTAASAAKPAAPAAKSAAPAAKSAAPAAKPAAPAVKPAAPAAKPAAPAVKPAAPAAVKDEFDLDSILEEFGK